MLPIDAVGLILLAIWGSVMLMWLAVFPYWEKGVFITEARRREIEEEKKEPREKNLVNTVWTAVAISVLLVLPFLFVVDALFLRIGLLYSSPFSFFLPLSSGWQVAGIVVSLLGLFIMVSVGRTLAEHVYGKAVEERILLTKGIYSRIRHPFYLHFVLLPLGLLLLTLNYLTLLVVLFYIMTDGPVLPTTGMRQEEQELLERYGEEYDEYMKRTGRFLPRLRK